MGRRRTTPQPGQERGASMVHSKSARLPKKPHKDFALYVHRSDRWAKKVRGCVCYFGKASVDPKGEAALAQWLEQKDELLAGRKPRAQGDGGLLLVELCDRFLASKRTAVESQRLSPRYWMEYKRAANLLLDAFGRNRQAADVRPEDFQGLLAVEGS